MKKYFLALFSLLLCWAAEAQTGTPLFQVIREGQDSAELSSALQDLLDDFQHRLPSARFVQTQVVRRNDQGQVTNHSSLDFSPTVARFVSACRLSLSCEALTQRELERNQNRLLQAWADSQKNSFDDEGGVLELAIRASVDISLRNLVLHSGKAISFAEPPMFEVAVRMWLSLGKLALAKDYHHSLIAQERFVPSAKPKGAVSHIHQARLAELLFDDLMAAREAWLASALSGLSESRLVGQRVLTAKSASDNTSSVTLDERSRTAILSMLELVRLDQQLGRAGPARQWLEAAEFMDSALGTSAATNCPMLRARLRQDLLLPRLGVKNAAGADALQTLHEANCGVVEFALGYVATRLTLNTSLHSPSAATGSGTETSRNVHNRDLQAMLLFALEQCKQPGKCFSYHREQLHQFLHIVQLNRAQMERAAQSWTTIFEESQPVGAMERNTVWALAKGLQTTGDSKAALKLLSQLIESLDQSRQSTQGTTQGLQNFARYDQLAREHVISTWRTLGVASAYNTDALRGQSLLFKLKRNRWAQEFAGVEDFSAKDVRDQRLAQFAAFRQVVLGLELENAGPLRVLREDLLTSLDDAEKSVQDDYYGALSVKRSGARAGVGLERASLTSDDRLKEMFEFRLDANEAYLSWLKVPGGFLGVLRSGLALSKNYDAADRGVLVPDHDGLSELLEIYRDLLRSGAGAARGTIRGARPPESALMQGTLGLVWAGKPLWRTSDGKVHAQIAVPLNGTRITRLSEISDQLFKTLLEPFKEHLKETSRLVISPDAELALLPFETLTQSGIPVIQDLEISYVQSLAVYFEMKRRLSSRDGTREPRASTRVFSMADPDFSKLIPPDPKAEPVTNQRANGIGAWMKADWVRLPGTRRESESIAALFPSTTSLLGTDASKARLMSLNASGVLAQFSVLHFATHGYVDNERSALVLSSPTRSDQTYLFDEELARLSLTSDLTILSACDTGLGREVSGEGVVGLPYALFMAGNANTLMSLWAVDDDGTAQFIPAFLERVKTQGDMVQALRQTKLAFARGDFGARLRDPRIWAPFVLYGASAK